MTAKKPQTFLAGIFRHIAELLKGTLSWDIEKKI